MNSGVGTPLLHHPRRLKSGTNEYVKHSNQRHGGHEEQKGGNLKQVIEQLIHDHAHLTIIGTLNDTKLQRLRYGQGDGQQPNYQNELDRPGQFGHGVREKGVTYRQVPFDRESSDGQHRGVGGGFGEEASQEAEGASEDVRVSGPDQVDLLREAGQQQEEIGDCQAEQVVVGGGVHGFVPADHHARTDVTNGAGHENYNVDYDYRYHYVQAVTLRSQSLLGALEGEVAGWHQLDFLLHVVAVNDLKHRQRTYHL